ncbi:PRD domain-containing protein [Pediococcus cellicola]|uniref:Beta-glucoside operon antiterminator n=1 Tax=Pediococcus cellicola TaxID=319652 RepID=A0A0R2IMN9_9LACO|nr:PRD domain-containing protein [Pediococcus cellicola]KRN66288.1 beta-glucoside operon antiterminator [Pediococcus cellicola]GEL15142.1 transcriptional regulator [Pediococcus cellicola]
MKAIKKINNNTAVCLDSQNHELIAIGRGIGFHEMPYEISDLSAIQRTFYNVDSMYIDLASEIPDDILETAAQIVDMVRLKVEAPINSNLVFTLADHIKFAIERRNKGMVITAPMQYDIQQLYGDEYQLGLKALKIVNQNLEIRLPSEEATNLALHFINAKAMTAKEIKNEENDDLISDITDIVSGHFEIYIDKHSFNYSRFVTHLQYLLKRQDQGVFIKSSNKELYENLVKKFPKTNECVEKIAQFLQDRVGFELEKEEKLYLILHVNRLCSREGL